MTVRPLLSATLICRDERQNVRRCLDSIWPHADQVVVVDTGSRDGTIAELKRYAAGQPEKKLRVGRFDWCDDFAAARNYADSLATGEWLVWADMDDEIVGLDRLREYAANAADDVTSFFVRYRYATDGHGNPISELWRERMFRNDGTPWTGRLHEHKLVTRGHIVRVSPDVAEWVHHRDHSVRSSARNLRILEAWRDDEPDNPRVVQSLALELMGDERHDAAAGMFERYLEMPGEPEDRRAQAARHLGVMLMMQGRPRDAKTVALRALAETWLWADTHLTLAEAEQTLNRPQEAVVHAKTALDIGKPDTLLIVNPLQYTAHPRALMAVCLSEMGRHDDALRACEQALEIAPSYPLAVQQLPLLRARLKKHLAVGTLLPLADTLLESGELIKARALLDQAPWYVTDDPRIVARRGELSALIEERAGGPKVAADDDAADAFVARHFEKVAA